MPLEWLYKSPPASHLDIVNYETELGYRLPEDYKQFLLTINGGDVDDKTVNWEEYGENLEEVYNEIFNSFKFFDDLTCEISQFYGLASEENPLNVTGDMGSENCDIRKNNEYLLDMPNWLIAIGTECRSTRYFVMDLRPEKLGRIYLYEAGLINPSPLFQPEEFVEDEEDLPNAKILYGEQASSYFSIVPSFSALLKMFNIPM